MSCLEDTVSYLLRSVAIRYRYYVHNVLCKYRWGVSQDLVIYHLAQQKGLNQKDLASKLNITPASVSSIVNQMEDEGLLVRIQDEKDERKFSLSLTEKGQSMVSYVIDSWLKIQEGITKGLSDEEKATFLHFLKQVKQNLDELTN